MLLRALRDLTIGDKFTKKVIDDEGNLPTESVLIENGILRGYMHDSISAKVMKANPTGNGRRQSYKFPPIPRMTNTYMRGGNCEPEEIIKSVRIWRINKITISEYFYGRINTKEKTQNPNN